MNDKARSTSSGEDREVGATPLVNSKNHGRASDPIETACEFCGEECLANRLNWAVWSSGGVRPLLIRLHHACMGDYARKRSAEGWA